MKDVSKLKDYRLKYKRYYGIEFDSDFDVHHIDFNRKNNDISNLILLPKELHRKYHFLINGFIPDGGVLSVHYKIDIANGATYEYEMMKQFCEVMLEIQKWKLYKTQLDVGKALKGEKNG